MDVGRKHIFRGSSAWGWSSSLSQEVVPWSGDGSWVAVRRWDGEGWESFESGCWWCLQTDSGILRGQDWRLGHLHSASVSALFWGSYHEGILSCIKGGQGYLKSGLESSCLISDQCEDWRAADSRCKLPMLEG